MIQTNSEELPEKKVQKQKKYRLTVIIELERTTLTFVAITGVIQHFGAFTVLSLAGVYVFSLSGFLHLC